MLVFRRSKFIDLPPELRSDALCFLQRKDVDACRLLSRSWKDMVDESRGTIPRHYVYSVQWEEEERRVRQLQILSS